jgi:dTDP-4-amino-4,6-dideoxygalactose transaminase
MPRLSVVKQYLANAYNRHWYTNNGPIVQEFELRLKKSFDYDGEIILCTNGFIALMLAFKVSNCRKALVPSFTFPATIQALNWCRIEYDYIDIDPSTWTIDPSLLEQRIKETDADLIVGVHTFGNPCDVLSIATIAKENDCKVIYDSAPAISSFVKVGDKNIHICDFGDISCFSLHATKVLNSIEGGVITTRDKKLAQEIRRMTNFGFDEYHVPNDPFGTNSKMSEIHASFGVCHLERLAYDQKTRNDIYNLYKKELSNVLGFQKISRHHISSHQVFGFQLPNNLKEHRDLIISKMAERGIECRKYYDPCLHRVDCFVISSDTSLPVTEDIADRMICLPSNVWLTEENVLCVCDSLHNIIEELL